MATRPVYEVRFGDGTNNDVVEARLVKWKVKAGSRVSQGTVLLLYDVLDKKASGKGEETTRKVKATSVGTIKVLLKQEGDAIHQGCGLLMMQGCSHPIVMKDMCAECGADLLQIQKEEKQSTASVSMVHSVPELMVSQEQAEILGRADEERLIKSRKLVLLVDLDQTLIHTTNDDIPPNLKDVHHFQMHGAKSPWYHVRLRPGTINFLEKISNLYELHICTFGARLYAHIIAKFLDRDGRFFSHRILSRDECFNANSKIANMKALFPCGDQLVCIIDDREDVWNFAPNLVHVKPYHFFQHTGDINAPPGLSKTENDSKGSYTVGSRMRKQKNKNLESKKEDSCPIEPHKDETEKVDDVEMPSSESKVKIDSLEEKNKVRELSNDSLDGKPDNVDTETSKTEDKPVLVELTNEEKLVRVEPTKKSEPILDEPMEKKEIELIEETKEKKTVLITAVNEESDDIEFVKEVEVEETKEKETVLIKPVNKEESDGIEFVKEVKIEETKEKETVLIKPANEEESDGIEFTKEVKLDETVTTTDAPSPPSNGTKTVVEKSESDDENSSVDMEDEDDYLLYLTDILTKIHKAFYKMYDRMQEDNVPGVPSLKTTVPSVRRSVLKGVNIVFSGVIPTNAPIEKSRAFHVAKCLGAEIQSRLVPRGGNESGNGGKSRATTHVVAARLGTVKVSEAKKMPGVHIVTPDWLWCCADRWDRVDERLFPLTKSSITIDPKCSSGFPQDNKSESIGDERKISRSSTTRQKTEVREVFPTYDSVTGKRINKLKVNKQNGREENEVISRPNYDQPNVPSTSDRSGDATVSNSFSESINPLMIFSNEDIENMDREVEDFLDSSDDDSSEPDMEAVTKQLVLKGNNDDKSCSSSSGESLSAERPKGWRKRKPDEDNEEVSSKRRCVIKPNSDNEQNESDDDDDGESIGSVDEEMAAEVERQFLGF